jgi:hypothetical protein
VESSKHLQAACQSLFCYIPMDHCRSFTHTSYIASTFFNLISVPCHPEKVKPSSYASRLEALYENGYSGCERRGSETQPMKVLLKHHSVTQLKQMKANWLEGRSGYQSSCHFERLGRRRIERRIRNRAGMSKRRNTETMRFGMSCHITCVTHCKQWYSTTRPAHSLYKSSCSLQHSTMSSYTIH